MRELAPYPQHGPKDNSSQAMRQDAVLHGDAAKLVRIQERRRELRRLGSPALHKVEAHRLELHSDQPLRRDRELRRPLPRRGHRPLHRTHRRPPLLDRRHERRSGDQVILSQSTAN